MRPSTVLWISLASIIYIWAVIFNLFVEHDDEMTSLAGVIAYILTAIGTVVIIVYVCVNIDKWITQFNDWFDKQCSDYMKE